jgi:energy-coupling factor transporter transmembrane protein EcfT
MFSKLEAKKSEKNMDGNNFYIRQSITFLLISILCTLFFIFLTISSILSPDGSTDWFVYSIFTFFAIFGFVLSIYFLRWKIKVINSQVIISPFIGKKKTINIDQLSKVIIKEGEYIRVFYENKKIFTVFPTCIGFNVLSSRLKKEQINIDFILN